MNIEEYRGHYMAKKGVTESTPFPKLPNILVFKVMGKMFTATDMNHFDGFSVKCVPETIEEMRAKHDALQNPSYFSKKHWCTALVDAGASNKELKEWLDVSYELVVAGLSKKLQEALKKS